MAPFEQPCADEITFAKNRLLALGFFRDYELESDRSWLTLGQVDSDGAFVNRRAPWITFPMIGSLLVATDRELQPDAMARHTLGYIGSRNNKGGFILWDGVVINCLLPRTAHVLANHGRVMLTVAGSVRVSLATYHATTPAGKPLEQAA